MKKVVVFGGSGLVGSRFIQLNQEIFQIISPDIKQVDILDQNQVLKSLGQSACDSVINFAAFTNVEEAEKQKGDEGGICYKVNAIGAKNIADACKTLDKHLIHISTEYVFDGRKSENPYTEEDQPNPINWYGQTKYFGEQFVLQSQCLATIVRICMPFSAFYQLKKDVARFFLEELKAGKQIKAVEDQKITPTLVDDIANALKVLVDSRNPGIYHVCSKNNTTPYEFARLIAQNFNLDVSLIKPISFDEYNKGKLAKLLQNSWLGCTKFEKNFGDKILHTIEEDIEIFHYLNKQIVDVGGVN